MISIHETNILPSIIKAGSILYKYIAFIWNNLEWYEMKNDFVDRCINSIWNPQLKNRPISIVLIDKRQK